MKLNKSLILDTETTGLITNAFLLPLELQPKIIEFFGLSLDTVGDEIEHFHQLYNPGYPLGWKITQITGLIDDDLKNKPSFDLIAATCLKDFIEKHEEVVAHNLNFDKQMIDFEMARNGLIIKWPYLICTVEATEYIRGFRLKMIDLYKELFGEDFDGAHRAEADVMALARVFKKLRQDGLV